ncbi:MAG: hypothetical protein IPF62_14115 [Bacteroidetes bacterium]|nr:hypothetical protein [Bacteroidota bacterium]
MRSFLIKTLLYISFLFTCFAISIQTCTAQTWVWAQKMGNTKSDKATCIKTDSSGFIYVSGYFSNSITLGTNQLVLNFAHNIQSKEAFVAKFDSTGYCYWANSGGQHYDDRVLGMDVDAEGNSVITGTFWEGAGIHFVENSIAIGLQKSTVQDSFNGLNVLATSLTILRPLNILNAILPFV